MDLCSKQALVEKAKKWMDPISASYPKDDHTKKKKKKKKRRRKKKKKSWVEDGRGKERQKVALRRAALQHPEQNKQHCTGTEWKMAKGKKRNTLTRSIPIEVVKTNSH